MRRVLPFAVLGVCLAMAAWAAGTPKNPFRSTQRPRPAPRRTVAPTVIPVFSPEGLEGLREVYVDVQVTGEAKFMTAAAADQKKMKADIEARLRKLGLKPVQNRAPEIPRLLVQVMGHTIPGYAETDPPAAAHMTVALIQPVLLVRRTAAGQPMQSYGLTYHATVFSTGRTSAMKARVTEKVNALVSGFEKDYRAADRAGK